MIYDPFKKLKVPGTLCRAGLFGLIALSLMFAPSIGFCQLNGSYTIDSLGSGANNFISFSEAAAEINSNGISGSVTFYIKEGEYHDQIHIYQGAGNNPNSRITFTPDTANTGEVVFHCSQTTSYTVWLEDVNYISFDNMRFEAGDNRGFVIQNSKGVFLENIFLRNNGSWWLIRASEDPDDLKVVDSELVGGSGPLWVIGQPGGYPGWPTSGVIINDNKMHGHTNHGVSLTNIRFSEFSNNTLTGDSLNGINTGAVSLGRCAFFSFTGNRISSDTSYVGYLRGLVLNNCPSSTNIIANNCIVLGSSLYGGEYRALHAFSSDGIRLYNNALIRRGSSGVNGPTIWMNGSGANHFVNNIIYNTNGYLIECLFASNGFGTSDHNVLYRESGIPWLIEVNSNHYQFNTWQNATSNDLNSINSDPDFSLRDSCYTCSENIANSGVYVEDVLVDLFGEPWNTLKPSIGPVQFSAGNSFLGESDTLCSDTFQVTGGAPNSTYLSINGVMDTAGVKTLESNCDSNEFDISVIVENKVCPTVYDSIHIRLVPGIKLMNDPIHLCSEDSVNIMACGNAHSSITWSNGLSGPEIIISEADTLIVEKSETGCQYSDTILVTKSDKVTLDDTLVCSSQFPIEIDGGIENGVTYAWSGGANIDSQINTFSNVGTYSLTATDTFTCSSIGSILIDTIPFPVARAEYFLLDTTIRFVGSSSFNGNGESPLWIFGNGATPTSSNQWSDTAAYSWYPVNVVDSIVEHEVLFLVSNECGVDTILITIEASGPPLAVSELDSGLDWRLAPNPTKGQFEILNIEDADRISLSIFDLTGQLVYRSQISVSQSIWIDLPSGAYVCQMIDSELNHGLVSKLVIAK